MRKLSSYKDGEALEILAELIEPMSRIMTNTDVVKTIKERTTKLNIAKTMISNCSDDVVKIFYALDEDPPKDGYNIFSLTKNLLDIINDKELLDFFSSQVQTDSRESSGSLMESTEETETK